MRSVCIKTAKSLINYQTYKTTNRSRSVEAQFQNLAGSLYLIYECLQLIVMQSNHDAQPNIVDAPLTLIFRIGQGVCHFPFCL